MNNARVCVVGSVNHDLIFQVGELPQPGATVLASSQTSAPGGKGANQAVAASRAGADVEFVGAVGDDVAGSVLRDHLRTNGVGTGAVVTVPGPSGTAIVVVDAHAENLIVVAPGANGLLVPVWVTASAISSADILLMQLEIPVATAVAAARHARAAGTTVILNASPVQEPDELAGLAELVDVVVVNEVEASHWPWPVPHRVVTRGADGASYSGPQGRVDFPSLPVSPVDTTGAGDVFAGVLAGGWRDGADLAVRRACAGAALATLVPGAGDCAPTREAITRALAQ